MTEEAPKAEEIMQPEAPANAAATEALEELSRCRLNKLFLTGLRRGILFGWCRRGLFLG
jgi:hypothetical protein